MKRCAKFALVVKQHWLDKIFAGEKDWEIRGCPSMRRGWIHLAQSKAGGTLAGRARLVDCADSHLDVNENHALIKKKHHAQSVFIRSFVHYCFDGSFVQPSIAGGDGFALKA